MQTPFFTMRNGHSIECGEPPVFDNEVDGKYYGYFENAFGEQWVFVYDRETKSAKLHGGDAGWHHVFDVVEGFANGLNLGTLELDWVRTCWRAATGTM